MEATLTAAETIASARRHRIALPSLASDIAPCDEAAGYRVQDAVHEILAPECGGLIGYKIGCTSAVMQRYLGIPHPCSGGMFANGRHESGAALRHADYVRVGVECEIGVRLGGDSDAAVAYTAGTVAPLIDAYLPAIEIVDDRYVDWRGIGAPTLVADDFFAAGCVLGLPVSRSSVPDLHSVIGRAVINGQEISRGTGADVLGHPHHALAWLLNHLAAQGKTLRAGDIVLTGSLVQTAWLKPGDDVVMELSGLGSAAVRFSD